MNGCFLGFNQYYKQRIKCLAFGHCTVGLEPATPQSQVEDSTTETLGYLYVSSEDSGKIV